MKKYSIEISSPIDRENLVAEIWFNDELVAELNSENDRLELEIYVKEDGKLSLDFTSFFEALRIAEQKLCEPKSCT